MSTEKRSSADSDGLHEPSATNADGAAGEQPSHTDTSKESASQPATASDGAKSEQPSENGASRNSTGERANPEANEAVNGNSPEKAVSSGPTKNPAAVFLGRLGGLKGGKARAKALTKRERSESARKAAKARWRKKKLIK